MGIVFLIMTGIYGLAIGGTALLLRLFPKLVPDHQTTLAELEEILPEMFDYSKISGGSS